MCESHTIYHLCGHVKIKTIIQCADVIEKLIARGLPVSGNHQICEENVSDNVHVFPDICDKCKATGIVGDAMEATGMKFEVLKAWNLQNKASSFTEKEDSDAGKINELETLDEISLSGDRGTPDLDSSSATESSKRRSRSVSSKYTGTTPELGQIKTRVATLMARTERLLSKIRRQKPPTLGQSSPNDE